MIFAVARNKRFTQCGVTLVELMMVVAVCAALGVGLAALIRLTADAWRSYSVKIELQRNAQQAMDRMMRDFKEANASSIGNMAYNSGFEIPLELDSPTGSKYGWQIPLPANVEKIGSGDQNLKSGFFAMKLENPASLANTINYESRYESIVSTIEFTGQYLFSGWLKAQGIAEFRLLRDTGAEFSPTVSAGCVTSTVYWQYFSKITRQTFGAFFKIRLANKTPGTAAYFDNVSLAPLELVFNEANGSGACRYEKITGLKTYLYRLYYNAVDKSLQRQVFSGGHWTDEGTNPLCSYVKSLTIKNNQNGSFSVRLILAKPVRGSREETYQLDNTIVPVSR